MMHPDRAAGERRPTTGGTIVTIQTEPGASSPFVGAVEAITATDDEIAAALADAEIPPLLPALAYLTGDLSFLRDDLRVQPLLMGMPQGGLGEDQQEAIRALALDALVAFRDGGCVPAPPPAPADLLRIMEFAVGGEQMAEYVPLLEEELSVRGEDRRAPDWRLDELATDRSLSVVIIGAGMSGILAGHRLNQAAVPYVILEKNDDVGGTWLENTYPGCRVDNPNHNYSYSFAQRHDWPLHFSTHDVLRGYFAQCADAFGVREHVRFGIEVTSAVWSDDDQQWTVTTRAADGTTDSITTDVLISAVGQLNRPSYPDIPGRDRFVGPSFHSARWDHDVDLTGRRVAVIGTGASAVQFVPEIAPRVGELLVFQRTPPWLGPTPDYHDTVAPGLQWLYAHVPSYSEWNRFWIFWRMGDGALEAVRVDPDYEPKGVAVSATSDMARLVLTEYFKAEFADRPDLLDHVVPTYPIGAKRLLRDNGVWPAALQRDNVTLVTDDIVEITPSGIVTADGVEHDVDVIVYGTGFQASKFLTPMSVTGRGGVDLHEQWGGDARAYLGVTVPHFPNFFCLYGPNTNIVINGSIIYFSECGVRYILGCLRTLVAGGHRSMDVRPEVHDAFNEAVDAENRRMAWGWSDVNSWYKSESGRVAQNWPFTLLDYWQRTLAPDPAEYELTD
jgi:4-hydroxyacetophenone monooxygenase